MLRLKRDVWSIGQEQFHGEHYAAYPQKLVEPCVLCGCPEGGIVLDPFMGSGTTAVVAKKLGRKYTGVEINPEYVKMAEGRIAEIDPLFAGIN
jgi:DNA modification methylase